MENGLRGEGGRSQPVTGGCWKSGRNGLWKSCREEKLKHWAGAFAGGRRCEIEAVGDRAGGRGAGKGGVRRRTGLSCPSLKDSCGSVLRSLPAPEAPPQGFQPGLVPVRGFPRPGFVSPSPPSPKAAFWLYRGGGPVGFIFPSLLSPLNNTGVIFPAPINLLSTEQFWPLLRFL